MERLDIVCGLDRRAALAAPVWRPIPLSECLGRNGLSPRIGVYGIGATAESDHRPANSGAWNSHPIDWWDLERPNPPLPHPNPRSPPDGRNFGMGNRAGDATLKPTSSGKKKSPRADSRGDFVYRSITTLVGYSQLSYSCPHARRKFNKSWAWTWPSPLKSGQML